MENTKLITPLDRLTPSERLCREQEVAMILNEKKRRNLIVKDHKAMPSFI